MLKSQEKDMEENVEVVNTPMGSITVEINDGAKVEIIGIKQDVNGVEIPKDPEFGFSVIAKTKKGNIKVVTENGKTLEVKPENVRNIK